MSGPHQAATEAASMTITFCRGRDTRAPGEPIVGFSPGTGVSQVTGAREITGEGLPV